MQLIFDHLGAVLIGVTVVLVLMTTQIRVQQNGIEQVVAHSTKTKALSLGQWLERDVASLGANFGRNLMRFEVPTYDEYGNTTHWIFYSDSVSTLDETTTRYLTRYTLKQVGLDETSDTERPLYELTRATAHAILNDGELPPIPNAAWAENGRSVNTLSRFRLELVDNNGTQTGNPELADFIRIEFSLIPELLRDQTFLNDLHWNTLMKVRPFWYSPPGGS